MSRRSSLPSVRSDFLDDMLPGLADVRRVPILREIAL